MDEPKPAPQNPAVAFVKDELIKTLTRWSFVGAAALLAWLFTPAGLKMAAIWNSPEQVQELQETLNEVSLNVRLLTREVEIARAPRDIVEYGPGSRFDDPCQPGQTCLLTLEIRRVSESSEMCDIVPGATRRQIISSENGRIWEPSLVEGQARNIGTAFVLNEIELALPSGLEPGHYYYRQTTTYEGCPWQSNGHPPVTSVSPLIAFEVAP